MIQFDDMDELFREAAGSYELTPRETAWRSLRRQLLWRKFRYVIGAGVLFPVILYVLLFALPGDESMSAVTPSQSHTPAGISSQNNDSRQAVATLGTEKRRDVPAAEVPVCVDKVEKNVPAGIARKPVVYSNNDLIAPANPEQHDQSFSTIGRLVPISAVLPSLSCQMIDLGKRSDTTKVFADSMSNRSCWLWSAEAYGGYGFSQFSGFSGGLMGQKELRDEGSWLLSPSAGALMRVNRKGWFLTAGLQWTRVGQKVQFDVETPDINPQLSHYDYDTTWVWIYDPPYYGEPWPASVDSTFVPIYYHQKFSGTLAVDYLTIPLMAGYEFRNDMLALGVGAGLAFSLPLSYHGKAPNAAMNRLFEASDELSHKVDIGFRFQLEAAARLRSYYWLFFRPVVGVGITDHTGRQSGLNFRNNSLGLDVGIRIDFNP